MTRGARKEFRLLRNAPETTSCTERTEKVAYIGTVRRLSRQPRNGVRNLDLWRQVVAPAIWSSEVSFVS